MSQIFQFDVVDLDIGENQRYECRPAIECTGKNWPLMTLKKTVEKWQTFIDGTDAWTTSFMENQ